MEKQERPEAQEILACETALILEEKEEKREPIPADGTDFWFAVIYTILGYSFAYLLSSGGFAWKFSAFTAVYAVAVLGYLRVKKKTVPRESWFWLAMMLGSGIPYGFYTSRPVLQVLGTMALGAYWTLAAGGCMMEEGRTSQWAAADFWNSIWVVPFGNFSCYFHVLSSGGEEQPGKDAKDTETGEKPEQDGGRGEGQANLRRLGIKKIGAVFGGLLLSVPILFVVLPLLASADDNFGRLVLELPEKISGDIWSFLVRAVFSLPVTAYLFGLGYGCIYKRKTDRIQREAVRKTGEGVRIVSDTAVNTALMTVSACYGLFMALQAQYLFSAFAGIRPETYTYAEYARKGFFELCLVAVVNLAVLLMANLFTRTKREESRWLRCLNLLLSVLTLLLISTAMSKMILYISAYGLTEKRITTMVFMAWLAIVFVLWCACQRRKLPMIRTAVMSGSAFYVMLCVLPLERIVTAINGIFFY